MKLNIKQQSEDFDKGLTVDKRIICNFLLKILDKKNKKQIRENSLVTFANLIGLNLEGRRKIGLSNGKFKEEISLSQTFYTEK